MHLRRMRMLIELDPKAAKKMMLETFEKYKCHRGNTAKELGCTAHTLIRWVRMLGLEDQMNKIEERKKKEGSSHGSYGGAGCHKNPKQRVKRSLETRAKNKLS